ncbi:LAFA_0C05424g1_1 [Lachancea sp. 'fantastica']|nr:LAFA_0C05424g1_1 [Lachancea sp. 'fantastica']
MDFKTLYQLSHEYADYAHKMRPFLASDAHVKQYKMLIYHAVNALKLIKSSHQLSAERDVIVTLELCDLLVQETHDLDLAEMYLSSVHERLYGTTLLHEKMLITSALVQVAKARNSAKYFKDALRLVTGALADLEMSNSRWLLYFQLQRIEIIVATTPSDPKISKLYHTLIASCEVAPDMQLFVICSYVCYQLSQNQIIDEEHLGTLRSFPDAKLPVQLKLWRKLVELLVLIYRDLNITTKLAEFKDLITTHKKKLTDSTFHLHLDESVSVSIDTPIARYKDFKNIILLFQSVSYLTNCYDKKANFSLRFLPKIRIAAEELKQQSEAVNSELVHSRKSFYKLISDLCTYYICLESLILTGSCADIEDESDYSKLVIAMKAQLTHDTERALDKFADLQHPKAALEFRMIGLCSTFTIRIAAMSRAGGTVSFPDYQAVTELWKSITSLCSSHDFHQNHIWDCTMVILWICSHFQPFTTAKLSKEDDPGFLKKLAFYFSANSFARTAKNECGGPIQNPEHGPNLKKSLLLHFLLNYLASAVLVNDLEEKCMITNTCFHLGKQQHMPLMEYTSGLSHLLNCGLAMKSKDVSITRNRLKEVVANLLNEGFQQQSTVAAS